MSNLLAYHSNPELKELTISAMHADIKAERLIGGHYWNGKTGCFVGCVIRGNEHSKFEDVLGIPRVLARMGDGIFEGLKDRDTRQKFAMDYLEAITPGADLSMVLYKFIHWLLVDPEDGVIKYAKTKRTKDSITKVAELYQQYIAGEISFENFRADAVYAAYAAAYAAADADAADAGKKMARIKQAEKLLQLMKEAPLNNTQKGTN